MSEFHGVVVDGLPSEKVRKRKQLQVMSGDDVLAIALIGIDFNGSHDIEVLARARDRTSCSITTTTAPTSGVGGKTPALLVHNVMGTSG